MVLFGLTPTLRHLFVLLCVCVQVTFYHKA